MTVETIIKVEFRDPPLREQPYKTDFFFGSLAAIYEVFTAEQVGCKVECLWNSSITEQHPYRNKKCVVSRVQLTRKAQKRGSRGRKDDGQ